MIDLLRQRDYFNPLNIKKEIHIIGVGAVGSHVAQNLARLGIKALHLWDFDIVTSHNIPNQMFK
jgi:tRNA A37 threonylcarbamoyladenosine dehydratase